LSIQDSVKYLLAFRTDQRVPVKHSQLDSKAVHPLAWPANLPVHFQNE
jgi:hypothetical protein